MVDVIVIGGGLAGSEAAWQVASRGFTVNLLEMRPNVNTGAHITADLAELVCSNSLGSDLPDRASGLLKNELRLMDSLLIKCAEASSVPAGGALAVDRSLFSKLVTEEIKTHPLIKIVRKECVSIPEIPTIIATGPLTSHRFASALAEFTGKEYLYFFDAISPIVTQESINMDIAFRASRYQKRGESRGDYINCPLTKDEYDHFVMELLNAERISLKPFEGEIETGVSAGPGKFFEGCLPIEIIAGRGHKALAYGPMRPVGLENPKTGQKYYAVVQLRQDNQAGTLYNLVGFQTNLKYQEQKRVFQRIPGLEKAEFIRYGHMHRNTYINSPQLLHPTLQFKYRENLFFAGQITGVEGYAGNIATGLLAGWNAARFLDRCEPIVLPSETITGALCNYITNSDVEDFQPMKANFGLLPLPNTHGRKINKRERGKLKAKIALERLDEIIGKSKN
jgi:methylenetetrahydrofolate--tRNA-(uracil-5-)-methyltransferase